MATVITNTDIGAFLGISGSPLKLVAQEQLRGQNYIVVYGNNQTIEQNGFELWNKYNFAKTTAPYGQPLSSTNRFTVFVAPGVYSLYSVMFPQLLLDTPYIDIISLSGEVDVFITSTLVSIPLLVDTSDIRLRGINVGGQAIHIKSSYADNYFENIIGGSFNFSNPNPNDVISGNFKNCVAGLYSFGDADSGQTVINSTFENCTADNYSFGYTLSGSDLKNCTGGFQSFGTNYLLNSTLTDCKSAGDSFGTNTQISDSTLTNCSAGSYSFGRTNGASQILDSTLINCTALEGSFSNYIENSTFKGCKAENNSFGVTSISATVSEIFNTTFTDCTAGNYSFGVRNGGDVTFTNCTAGVESFGADQANATYKNCKAGLNSFGAGVTGSWSTLIAGGQFYNCVADENSFGANFANGIYYHCVCNGLGGWNGGTQSGMGGFAFSCKGMNPNGPGQAAYCLDAALNPVNFNLTSTTNNI